MFDAETFREKLQELCGLLNRPSPVVSIVEEEDWVLLHLSQDGPAGMKAPTAKSAAVAAARSVDIVLSDGCSKTLADANVEMPSTFYHGTSPELLLSILLEGQFATADDLRMKRHTPDGLYAYGDKVVSTESCYTEQGCQVKFKVACFPITVPDSRLVDVVPEGAACRFHRSAHYKHKSKGTEWVFNPQSCHIQDCRILMSKAHCLMQAVTAALANLGAGRLQPPLASSSSHTLPAATTASTSPSQQFYKARCTNMCKPCLPHLHVMKIIAVA